MLLGEVREEIVDTCRRLSAAGLLPGTSGNVSVRAGDHVAVTPSGVDYSELTAELVGVHALDGTPVDAPLKPTSELPLHLAVYAAKETSAIVHTHSTAATVLSTLVDELPPIHYMIALFGGPVRVTPYATYGTRELADATVRALRESTGCILGNHGTVAVGADLGAARTGAEYLEWLSELYLRAVSAGKPRLLDAEEIARVAAKLSGYGQTPPR
ncbi:class II aldolase/adducin family protein [Actinoallomurus rhizosphaericola]|uniref:class II aldolase/adducin family protein n=1 Tax=Actinoallomurus rhizosphaericola TaxID=2952536 RepID=UPI002092B4C2|nr:class II aldolase/adducin family protein [Actinoallomurus rhizosphaericola]MCO5999496.1 class II aldolase/adducin family protein [Actinoallomurus rhizosphaericola]